jgi:hypothetical protein
MTTRCLRCDDTRWVCKAHDTVPAAHFKPPYIRKPKKPATTMTTTTTPMI